MVSFLCCKAAPDEDAPSTPKKKKSAVAPRQPSPEEPEETVVETKEEPEDEGPQDGGSISCGGGPEEPCRGLRIVHRSSGAVAEHKAGGRCRGRAARR